MIGMGGGVGRGHKCGSVISRYMMLTIPGPP